MTYPHYPSLYQVNTRVWLTQLSRALGRTVTLDDIPDAELDAIKAKGIDWVWLLSVWQTGAIGREVSRHHAEWRHEFLQTLPDLREEDIGGSGFAIAAYTVDQRLGGDAALARLRERLRRRGLRLLLDFVPNHMALDHPWVEQHPDYFISGTEQQRLQAPQNYTRVKTSTGDRILAYGRDPYFAGWPDTLQLNYANPATQDAMVLELTRIAGQCDGVRCDMAMLVLPDVFARTWGMSAQPFWPRATTAVREHVPGFCFIAEVYWDLEWTLQQQGFNYTYDKRLYDRLRDGHGEAVRGHLLAPLDYQDRMARFLENHDEPRAAVTFPPDQHEAAAVITYLSPGLRFFHHGQFEGRVKRISPHLVRGPDEPTNQRLLAFYERLLAVLRQPLLKEGRWQLLDCHPAWDGNGSWNAFIAYAWQGRDNDRLIVAVNYADHQSQCYVGLPFPDLAGRSWRLRDLLGEAQYDRHGHDLQSRGLYLDVRPWQSHVFELTNT